MKIIKIALKSILAIAFLIVLWFALGIVNPLDGMMMPLPALK